MKKLFLLFLLGNLPFFGYTQNANPNYDEKLATELGGDDYGMKSYVLVILKSGDKTNVEKAFADSCFRSHMNNINRLVELNKLIVAGPMGKNEDSYRGIFILNVADFEEAQMHLQGDAAISEGLLVPQFYKWYGSAALPTYLESSDKIWRVKP